MLDYIEKGSKNLGGPKKLVILIHGYGADKNDLFDLIPYFSNSLPDTHFISVEGPENCEIGFGYQWFSLKQITLDFIIKGAEKAYGLLNSFITRQLQRFNLKNGDLLLIGFSQGAMMSLYAGLQREENVAGIISFSGSLPFDVNSLKKKNLNTSNILLTHGTADDVLPYDHFLTAQKLLKELNIPFESCSVEGMGHYVNAECIDAAKNFIRKSLD